MARLEAVRHIDLARVEAVYHAGLARMAVHKDREAAELCSFAALSHKRWVESRFPRAE